MQTDETVLDGIEIRKLRWFGHLMRMPEGRWPARIHSWIPEGRRKRGRPWWSWWDGVSGAMEKRGIVAEDVCVCVWARVVVVVVVIITYS
jgi:hypothetical protein